MRVKNRRPILFWKNIEPPALSLSLSPSCPEAKLKWVASAPDCLTHCNDSLILNQSHWTLGFF